jgi:hypothetical protein
MTDTPSSRQAGVTEPRNAVAVLGTGIMGSAMAAGWPMPGSARRCGTGRRRRLRRWLLRARW